jgi:hypothetical protein
MNRSKESQSARKYSKPISLYPLSLDDTLRAALQTPPEKKRTVRAAMEIQKNRIEIFKEGEEGEGKSRKEKGNTEK